ncbi:uncharacterized protein MELLADRAFT_110221 [Melampsora larici-populina 98AG31]|uniref:F-box domain-containing protein n=1 Tax=Melampsora larici-populina (strain 98AG31 / pathotype 3-4-7) TaxID=747676 RepID=F4RZ26_MELLP|nr:uncharacterized protein MELLADRAFT_110221 [Melampsora larici-populina 98AG31]EGG02344.1 hypothetical protein MELLADRAFT_110221 [Melampsora larici-populina 98AG31]
MEKNRKRSAEAPASSNLSTPSSSRSDPRPKRATSEPLQQRNKLSPSPTVLVTSNNFSPTTTTTNTTNTTNFTPSSLDSHPSIMLGSLSLEILVYVASLVGERELIRLACCSRPLRLALLALPFLWSQRLTIEISNPSTVEQVQTLFFERADPRRYQALSPPISTHGPIGRWIVHSQATRDRPLRRLSLRLAPPLLSLNERGNRYVIIPDQPYWNTNLLVHNLRAIRSLLNLNFGLMYVGLMELDIRLDGQFDQTLQIAHELWTFIQTPWARTVVDFKFLVSYPYARIPPRTLFGLMTWMPDLKSVEIEVVPGVSGIHRKPTSRDPKFALGGGNEIPEQDPNGEPMISKLERISLVGMELGQLVLPDQFPVLRSLLLKNVGWGRMLFSLLRKSPNLVSLILYSVEFEHESDDEVPLDLSFWENLDEEMSELGSDESALGQLRPPPIQLNSLKNLELAGITTPVIWSLIGDLIPNPIIKMPNLKRLMMESMELDEEEQALIELTTLAPLIKEMVVRNCTLREEADLYHCIRCLPYLEMLDLRQTENITSQLINALALSVPNISYLDVRGCGWVQIGSVARLAETIRDSSDGLKRLELIGVDLPGYDDWEGWEAWKWLEFTHVLIDVEEWKERRRYRKDKGKEVLGGPTGGAGGRIEEEKEMNGSSSRGERERVGLRVDRDRDRDRNRERERERERDELELDLEDDDDLESDMEELMDDEDGFQDEGMTERIEISDSSGGGGGGGDGVVVVDEVGVPVVTAAAVGGGGVGVGDAGGEEMERAHPRVVLRNLSRS